MTKGVGDPPVAGEQLNRLVGIILDPDVIDPEPLPRLDPRLLRQEIDRDPHGDAIGHGSVLEQLLHAAKLAIDIEEAMKVHNIKADWTAESLALHTQAVLQGAFILAKAQGTAAVAADSVDHLHRYIEMLLEQRSPNKPID